MLPWLILAVVAVPLVVIAFLAARRTRQVGEHPVPEDEATRQEIEKEFAAAEAYQEEWRAEEKKHQSDSILVGLAAT